MKPKFMMLCGLPGCGKSTFSRRLIAEFGAVVHSSDALRKELFGDEDDQSQNGPLFAELGRRVKASLKAGESVIYDATNISSKRRKSFLQELRGIDCEKICYILATPLEQCFRNNQARTRFVPEEAIRRMQAAWNTPGYFEGWDRIAVVYPFPEFQGYLGAPETWPERLAKFSQDNPHHTLMLGEHLAKTQEYISAQLACRPELDTPAMRVIGFVHDIGKKSTKVFHNTRGEATEIAHFYSHENVGAYEALFLDAPDVLEISLLVSLHMKPYAWDGGHGGVGSEKTARKYRELWGETLYQKVLLVHGGDRAAH